jgi:threonine dehydratase
MTSRILNELLGMEVFLKCENFQRVGAFKFRGAFNTISQLTDQQKHRGIITYSSGNHAQAVALVGQLLKVKTTVVMPNNAPRVKRAATEGYGAAVIEYDPEEATREEMAELLRAEHGYTIIPPFDHLDIIAGQGTAALEMFEELKTLDMLLVPCGGGGLLSGSAIATKGIEPACRVIGIEPELADDATRSFHTKTLHTVKNPPFPLVLEYVDDMRTVTETAIVEAVQFLFYRMKIVVEPSGALGLAALLSDAVSASGRVGVIISGGNVDGDMMSKILLTE